MINNNITPPNNHSNNLSYPAQEKYAARHNPVKKGTTSLMNGISPLLKLII
ncbi:hypothetical protein KXQ82_09375 [Mucilaginibacter sp. HMF5004]|uniref:hypothetical protein n=1 Tax=Mucilaginibacter rivuli TaxID=2857527 RepID=UPI001C5FCD7C|nr:hypothetical protein [Mucilaginibacter rivuli]MBW4889927.1 hypothetical protein [Mucilaginibacter rivuli]